MKEKKFQPEFNFQANPFQPVEEIKEKLKPEAEAEHDTIFDYGQLR